MDIRGKIFQEIDLERERQDAKWGPQGHGPVEWIAILGEEFGEVSKEALEFHFSYGGDQIERLLRYRKELIQVAAVAVSMIESLERENGELEITREAAMSRAFENLE